nr:MAG TPA: hypothetical protein [Bacteriophage sp.]
MLLQDGEIRNKDLKENKNLKDLTFISWVFFILRVVWRNIWSTYK